MVIKMLWLLEMIQEGSVTKKLDYFLIYLRLFFNIYINDLQYIVAKFIYPILYRTMVFAKKALNICLGKWKICRIFHFVLGTISMCAYIWTHPWNCVNFCTFHENVETKLLTQCFEKTNKHQDLKYRAFSIFL